MVRRQPWLVWCVGESGSSASASGSGSGGNTGKERRSSLYTGSNGNQSSTHTHTDAHGTSLLVQRSGWAPGAAVATLPYPHSRPPPTQPPLPKSATTTWDPHRWKNISFKSYSRDSGHGGSEKEESPRAQSSTLNHLPPHLLGLPHSHRGRAVSPWNHTYTEIREAAARDLAAREEDPVYEEIERERERERHEVSVSDMSDEDGRRQSDMSRQSSRSYGDHRPLIPYSPPHLSPAPNFQMALDAALRHRLEQCGSVAVLDGETVVCHLTPEHPHLYSCRTMIHQPYSEC